MLDIAAHEKDRACLEAFRCRGAVTVGGQDSGVHSELYPDTSSHNPHPSRTIKLEVLLLALPKNLLREAGTAGIFLFG